MLFFCIVRQVFKQDVANFRICQICLEIACPKWVVFRFQIILRMPVKCMPCRYLKMIQWLEEVHHSNKITPILLSIIHFSKTLVHWKCQKNCYKSCYIALSLHQYFWLSRYFNAYKTCDGHKYGHNDFGNIDNSQRKDGRQQERLITLIIKKGFWTLRTKDKWKHNDHFVISIWSMQLT